MRLILTFEFEHDKFTNQYRNFLMSYFKFALSKEYYEEFISYYNADGKTKGFSFAVYIKNMKHENNFIISPFKSLVMIISSSDYHFINMLYNALLINRRRKMDVRPDNKIHLEKLSLNYLKDIKENEIKIKMLSPFLIRDRDVLNNKDYYKTIEDEDFIKKANDNLIFLANKFNLETKDLSIKPIKAKKVVIPIMKVRYNATDGKFILKGNIDTLNYFYKNGIGSRRGYGFGLFEIEND